MNYPTFINCGQINTKQFQDEFWDILKRYPMGGGKPSYIMTTLDCLAKFHDAYREANADFLKMWNTENQVCVDYAVDYIAAMGRHERWQRAIKILAIGKDRLVEDGERHAFVLLYGYLHPFSFDMPAVPAEFKKAIIYADPRVAGIWPLRAEDYNTLAYGEITKKTGIDALVLV